MQLIKTIALSAELTVFYHRQERREINLALGKMAKIEAHLSRLAPPDSCPNPDARQWIIQ